MGNGKSNGVTAPSRPRVFPEEATAGRARQREFLLSGALPAGEAGLALNHYVSPPTAIAALLNSHPVPSMERSGLLALTAPLPANPQRRSKVSDAVSFLGKLGYRPGKATLLEGRSLGAQIEVTRHGDKISISHIEASVRSKVPVFWLLQQGEAPQVLGRDWVRISNGALIVRDSFFNPGLRERKNETLSLEAFRIERQQGKWHLSRFVPPSRPPPESASVKQYLLWLLGESKRPEAIRPHRKTLAELQSLIPSPEICKRLLDALFEISDLSHPDNLRQALEQIHAEVAHYRDTAKDAGWPQKQAEMFLAEFLQMRIRRLQNETSVASEPLFAFLLPIDSGIKALGNAGLSPEQSAARVLQLAKADPSLERVEALPFLTAELESLARNRMAQAKAMRPRGMIYLEAELTTSELIERVLELTPEGLGTLLEKLAQRDIELGGEASYQNLVNALKVSLIQNRRSPKETLEMVQAFLDEPSLNTEYMSAYASLSTGGREAFLRKIKVAKLLASVFPRQFFIDFKAWAHSILQETLRSDLRHLSP